MPAQATIADGVIKIALQGLQAAKEQLNNLKTQTKQLSEGMSTIGSASARGFAVVTGSVTNFLRAADPVRFEIFSQKIQIAAMYLGRMFIPALIQATNYLDQLIGYLRSLTPEQEAQIRKWVKITTAVLAAGTAMGVMVSVGGKLVGTIHAVSMAIRALTASTGVGLVLVLAGAAYGVYELLKATGQLDPVLDQLNAVVSTLAPVFAEFAAVAGDALAELMPAIREAAAGLVEAFKEAAPDIIAAVKDMAAAIKPLIPVLVQLAGLFLKAQTAVWVAELKILTGVIQVAAAYVSTLAEGYSRLAKFGAELYAVMRNVAGAFQDAFGDKIKAVVEFIANAVQRIVDGIKAMIDRLKQAKEMLPGGKPAGPSGGGGSTRGGILGGIAGVAVGGPLGGLLGGYLGRRVGSSSAPASAPAAAPVAPRAAGGGWGDMIGKLAGAVAQGTTQAQRTNPLPTFKRPEFVGIEEGFRKAHSGAVQDPTKIAERERLKLAQEGNQTLRTIAENTTPSSDAAVAY